MDYDPFFFGAPPASRVAQVPNGGGGGGGRSDTFPCSETFFFTFQKGGGQLYKTISKGGGHGPVRG